MDSKNRSLSERKQQLIDEMMAAGTGGFSAAAPAEGPVAGYDPLMQKTDKVMKRRKKKKEKSPRKPKRLWKKHATVSLLRTKVTPCAIGSKVAVGNRPAASMTANPALSNPTDHQTSVGTLDDRAAMDKDERDRRAKKKRREDPDADRSGAAKNVTEENVAEAKDACYQG